MKGHFTKTREHLQLVPAARHHVSSSDHCEPMDRHALLVLPQTLLERMLAEIWCEVLEIPYTGIYNSFFDLGGDALTSLEMHCLVVDKGFAFSIQHFMQNPTIFGLAQLLHPENTKVGVKDIPQELIA